MTAHDGLRSWVLDELVRSGFDPDEAAPAAERAAETAMRASLVVASLRAARTLPEGDSWWRDEHHGNALARRGLLEGNGDEAGDRLGERLAVPAPDVMDMNYPAAKVWQVVPVPSGTEPGDTMLAGDGQGSRVTLIAERRDGGLGWVLVDGTYGHGLDPWWDPALTEAQLIVGS